MVVPPFTALLTQAAFQFTSNKAPFLLAMNVHEATKLGIFLGSPWSLDEARFQHLLPTMKTLNIGSSRKPRGNLLPTFPTKGSDSLAKMLVFDFSPLAHGGTAFEDSTAVYLFVARRHSFLLPGWRCIVLEQWLIQVWNPCMSLWASSDQAWSRSIRRVQRSSLPITFGSLRRRI